MPTFVFVVFRISVQQSSHQLSFIYLRKKIAIGKPTIETISALRDFFIARNGSEMGEALQLLCKSIGEPPSISQNLDDLEFSYNRLFIGPKSVPAPPFASVYIDPEHQLMGVSTTRILNLYKLLGLSSPWEGSVPPDHLSVELDAVIHFKNILAENYSEELTAIWHYFLHNHLAVWVPQFIDRVMAEKNIPAELRLVINQLREWLEKEIAADTQSANTNS